MNKLIVILGPTASGKTSLAVQLARAIDGEIISADSRQVYRAMNIGTGKDLDEYTVDGRSIPNHIIDCVDAGEKYNINQYFNDFEKAYKDIVSRNKQPILCGGSGLYIETALKGNELSAIPVNEKLREELNTLSNQEIEDRYLELSEDIREKLDGSTLKRMIRAIEVGEYVAIHGMPKNRDLGFEPIIFGLNPDRDVRRDRISKRLRSRMEEGMLEEVKQLIEHGVDKDVLRYYGLEYKWIVDYLDGIIDKERLMTGLETAIHQFAKRQMTWFRRMEKQGWKMIWLSEEISTEEKIGQIKNAL